MCSSDLFMFVFPSHDKRPDDHFYDMCESFDDVDEDDIANMLSDKGIEVVFLED